jgi:UDP-glucose 4-epimerase
MIALVTGGSGLIGRPLIDELIGKGYQVFAISRRAEQRPLQGLIWLHGDLSRPSLPDGFPPAVDLVVHLAQSDQYRQFPAGAMDVFAVNVASTVRLLDWSCGAGVRRFVYASSGGVDRTRGFYQASKRCAELLAHNYEPFFDVVGLRFFFVYGAGQRPTMLVPRLIEAVRCGRPIPLDGPDGILVNPLHVADAVNAAVGATEFEGSRTFDVAGPDVLSIREIATIVGQRLERTPLFDSHDHTPSAAGPLVGDITDMSRWLAAPTIRFVDGIAPMCRAAVEPEHEIP